MLGTLWAPNWRQLWLKAFGTACLAGDSAAIEQIETRLTDHANDSDLSMDAMRAEIVSRLRRNSARTLGKPTGEKRWAAGIQYIYREWGQGTLTANALRVYETPRTYKEPGPSRETPLRVDERDALVRAMRYADAQSKSITQSDLVHLLEVELGYGKGGLKKDHYNGFLSAKTMFEQAVSAGIIKYGHSVKDNVTFYLPDEEIPNADEGET